MLFFKNIVRIPGKRSIGISLWSTSVPMFRRDNASPYVPECTHLGRYLGHPFCKPWIKSEAYRNVMEIMANKLAGWKQKSLSMVGRMVLIKSVAQAVPSYIMQTVLLPQTTVSTLDRLTRNFFWVFHATQRRHLYLHAWDKICRPKDSSGLGIRKLGDLNKSLVAKLAWSVCKQLEKTWVQLIKAKYMQGRRRLDFQ